MLPLLPAILQLAPTLAEWLGGPKASAVATQAISVVQAVTGSTDPEVIANLHPEKRTELQIRLAEIGVDQRRLENEEMASARAMTLQSRLIAIAQVTGGGLILAVWGFMILRMAIYGLPYGSSEFFATVLAGVSGILGGIIQFFYGNSTASHAANQRLDQLARQAPLLARAATPPAIINQPSGTVVTRSTTEDLNDASLRTARER